MAIRIVCTSCGSKLEVPYTVAGRVVKCPKCAGRVVVPPICSVATSPRPARKVHGPAPASAKSAMSVRRAQNKQLPASPGPGKASSRVDERLWVVSLVFILLVVGGAAAVYIFDPFEFRAASTAGLDASAGGGANTLTTPVKPSPGADLVSPVDKNREKRTTDLVTRGKQLIAQRKLDEAWQCYKDASVIKPEDPRVQELRKLVEEARVKPATEPPKTVEMPKPDESPQATAADPKPVPLFNNNTKPPKTVEMPKPDESPQATAADPKPVPLFNNNTKLELATVEDTPTALITRVADRVRDRHAREYMFRVYEHYVGQYFEHRTHAIEIVDKVAKGGDSVTYNITTLAPSTTPNLRAFFEGKGTVAQYTTNSIANRVDPLHYTQTLKYNTNENRPIKIGDRIEIEFSVFLQSPATGRIAYYGTPLLYVVGKPGIQPWEGIGKQMDSFPLPAVALSGGLTTSHQNYSNEPKSLFGQMATNTAPINSQPFMLGRRLVHTDMSTGVHSEQPGNPVFTEMIGKLGPRFAAPSCIACAGAKPPAVGKPMLQYLVKVGSDAKGTPHSQLGSVLQPQAARGATPEGSVSISGWATTEGTYGDGTKFSLQKPEYKFAGVVPEFYSVRIAISKPVGMGLLEAIDENAIITLAANNTGRMSIVTDPETGQLRMGRFGWKASQASLKHQVASRLNDAMSITTTIFPNPDRGSAQPDLNSPSNKLADADVQNIYRYYSLRAVPPRRDFRDDQVLKGEKLFMSAKCDACHTPTMKTSPYHPMAELRNQTIHPYTDMLLHNMGQGLADNMGEGNVTGAEWRTPPLWGLGLIPAMLEGEVYLHDGRARNLSEAILWHGAEGHESKEVFRTMSADDRAALIRFLKSL